ncbi:Pyrimidine 5'-nucleotidase YjjG [Enhygromyxa salina]|uniref:Pyrimidine 5'-nucleotidase YjjG n=1 Tax=Enhygromyxa salina TaxID=215803 RepID=A0A2S9XEH0_9BACT|nr:HAD family hydrolase [Enhygromyxa salina]PRP91253.1 Pyrimidine 5'-nucleotidase YjjG [Enhygromyxa salina]
MSPARARPIPAREHLGAVLIDLDGTLVDRDAAVRAWLQTRGHGREAARFTRGRSLESLAAQLLRHHPGLAPSDSELAARIRAELPALIPRERAILEALEQLASSELVLALVSNGGGRTQRAKLAAAGIDAALFAAVLISGEHGLAKPDARMFALALNELDLRPDHAIMIGDSPEHDIAGAAAAGLASCWIAHGRTYPRSSPAPSMVAPHFSGAVRRLLGLPAADLSST